MMGGKWGPIDLTVEQFITYKHRGFSNRQIAQLVGVSLTKLNRQFIAKHNLQGRYNARDKTTETAASPEKLKKMIKKYKEGRAKHWSDYAIRKEIGLSSDGMVQFKKRHFPEDYKPMPERFTPEEKELAKRTGVAMRTVYHRMCHGMSRQEALTKPPRRSAPRFTKQQSEYMKEHGIPRHIMYHRTVIWGMTWRQAIDHVKREREKRNEADKAKGN